MFPLVAPFAGLSFLELMRRGRSDSLKKDLATKLSASGGSLELKTKRPHLAPMGCSSKKNSVIRIINFGFQSFGKSCQGFEGTGDTKIPSVCQGTERYVGCSCIGAKKSSHGRDGYYEQSQIPLIRLIRSV